MTEAEVRAVIHGIVPTIKKHVDQHVKEAIGVDGLADVIVQGINAALVSRDKKIGQLESKVADLEARPTMKYMGVWRADFMYSPGHCVTHDGSIWHCNSATYSKPGSDGCFTLAVKHGQDRR